MSNTWRWLPSHPIAAWIASCRSARVMSARARSRRQIGGLAPRNVTLRLKIGFPAFAFGFDAMPSSPAALRALGPTRP